MPLSKRLKKKILAHRNLARGATKTIVAEPKHVPLRETVSNLPVLSHEENTGAFEEGQLSVDVFQTPEEIVVVAPVAGVTREDLSVNVTDEVLHIRGRRNFSFKIESDQYFSQECFWGNFSRSIILPDSIDAPKVKATFKDGVLIVRIPKVEKIRSRTIEIKEE